MKKINVAEILRNCPQGMELYSPLCGKCVFDRLNMGTIICKKQNRQEITFTSEGYYMLPLLDDCECMLFPSKDQRDWSKFQRPFKDGDIISDSLGTCIFKGEGVIQGTVDYYCGICDQHFNVKDHKQNPDVHYGNIVDYRLATEKEKENLFQAIKDNGYRWDEETKTLEKIKPKFHEGDWIVFNGLTLYIKEIVKGFYRTISKGDDIPNSYDWDIDNVARLWTIKDAEDGDVLAFYSEYRGNKMVQVGIIEKYVGKHGGCSNTFKIYVGVNWDNNLQIGEYMGCSDIRPATKEQRDFLFQKMKEAGYEWNSETKTSEKLITPRFKVGDRIRHIVGREEFATVVSVEELHYNLDSKVGTSSFSISLQHEWELVPNKFDINTLVSFESRVLVRDYDDDKWHPGIWGFYDKDSVSYPYRLIGDIARYCIPYEGNEHLLGTTNDCIDFYKTWNVNFDL